MTDRHVDPLRKAYRRSLIDTPQHFEVLHVGNTALLCVDLQYLDAAEGYGLFREPEKSGVSEEGRRYYFDQLKNVVLPNVRKLQERFRDHGLEVIHARIQSLTRDGRDRSLGHKRLGVHAAPGSKEAEFLDEVAPEGDEIVLNKTASGVFSSTNIDYVLDNLGIEALFIVGVYTNECVETAVRSACDIGYLVTLVEDACTTVTPELHEATLTTLRDRYARVITTEQAIEDLDRYAAYRTSAA